ncbi:pseudouridine synthase [Spirochaeta cellobiosiphila]|uniref:pseudouridine synthase n=1 Tax=Spirochaeta cellobiosiphila TaxID=504483 RepID=UPI0004075F27|nr:RluA family pseudouridine synthase [Spirochaeta cellobiosiphila]
MRRDRFKSYKLTENEQGKRVDNIVKSLLPQLKKGDIYKGIRKKDILINGRKTEANYNVMTGDSLDIYQGYIKNLDEISQEENHLTFHLPPIVYESEDIVVYNKMDNLITQGPASLESEHYQYFISKKIDRVSFRPGPLHRLDKNTSGLVSYSLSLKGARSFTEAIQEGRIKKLYLAVLEGHVENKIHCQAPLIPNSMKTLVFEQANDKTVEAETIYHPLEYRDGKTTVIIELLTGRTHQIRAHAQYIGYPVVGDYKYGTKDEHMYLHSAALYLPTPITEEGQWIWGQPPKYYNKYISLENIENLILNFIKKNYITH